MGSAVVPPVTMEAMSRNMVWDGLFHLATWTITVGGVFFLWDVGRRGTLAPTSALLPFVGQLLIGWGAFNLVEGLVDHHVLGLHHIRDLPVHVPLYDWIFLSAGGVGLLLVAWGLSRSRTRPLVRTERYGEQPPEGQCSAMTGTRNRCAACSSRRSEAERPQRWMVLTLPRVTGPRQGRLVALFSSDIASTLVFSQSDESGVSKMIVCRPF
jgi:uncharacterized membrane protein